MQKHDWENKFDSVSLSRGKALCQEDKIVDFKKEEGNVSASLMLIPRYEVSFVMRENMPIRMKCQCPKYRSGRNCEHLAAVLYKLFDADEKAELERQREAEKVRAWEAARKKHEEEVRLAEEAARKKEQEEAKRRVAEEAARAEAAQKAAKEAEEKERKKQAVAERIAQREAEKKAKKAERKRKRIEAEQRVKAMLEEELKRAAEERVAKEAAAQKAAEEAARAEAARKAEEEVAKAEAARKAEEKVAKAKAAKKNAERISEEAMQRPFLKVENRRKEQTDVEKYRYFDFDILRKELGLTKAEIQKGSGLRRKGQIILNHVEGGYADNDIGYIVEVKGMGITGTGASSNTFPLTLVFSAEEIHQSHCQCRECGRGRFFWYEESKCAYVAALLEVAEEYIQEHSMGDATDRTAMHLLYQFQNKRAREVIASNESREGSLQLEPKLTARGGKLALSFRVGEKKLFVVKDLFEFCSRVRNSENGTYGNSTQFNHQLSNFDERSRKWYGFINKVIQEEEELERRIEESYRYTYRSGKCSALELYGWRLDLLFDELSRQGLSVVYEDKDSGSSKKEMITACEHNPKLRMEIDKSRMGDGKIFHGVEVSCRMPVFYQGVDNLYCIEESALCKVQEDFSEQILPMAKQTVNGRLHFRIGRKKLSDFYYSFVPKMQEYFEIVEKQSQEIHSYLPPEAGFVFYLDAKERNMTCRVHAIYGETELSVLELLDEEKSGQIEAYRMKEREGEMLYRARQFFPEIDMENDELHCDGNEEKMYSVLEGGVDELLKYGEVKCTQRFKGMNLVQRAKVSVGVSVSKGLLNLEIATEDISREELLDILKGYRTRKRFYRLKNGDFLNLENASLQVLNEMMETMHLSPKEFVKGKMQLPAYRTLYLDKLLSESEDLYLTRDSRFREMVKNFKTINDADYEEPAGLSNIMRGYQKNGYKWLRTLEGYGFGGILADDMGLGKTLQMIAVLRASVEAKTEGCSLVVCPSSLVYNWEEEFHRFAPELKVLTVTGGQELRQKKLQEWQTYDVLITSYDLLKRDILSYEEMQFVYEIIDEAQYIKNHTTAAARAVKVIHSRMKFALTGTPIENRLSELWSIFDYLMPGFLYGYDVFKRTFETPIVKNGDEDAMKRLQRMVGPFILRRLKKDVLKDLPDKLEEVRYVQLADSQQTAYDAQVVHMQAVLNGQSSEEFAKSKLQILAELTRLRQICCDPALCFENYKGESAKLEACVELIQSAIDGGHKILLFSQFTSMLELLQKCLKENGIAYYLITGETPKEQRLQLVKSFNEDDTPVFLISLKAGGVGLNLTGADVVIHYDPWWNIAAQNQATDRAHRIGQTKKVTVYKLIARNTIEEKILKLQETKRDLADSIVNEQTGQFATLSREELLELLG